LDCGGSQLIIEPQAAVTEIIAPFTGQFFLVPFNEDRNVGNFIDAAGHLVG